jgi:hypothetical protein
MTFYATGAAAELARLKISDIDISGWSSHVQGGKGHQES